MERWKGASMVFALDVPEGVGAPLQIERHA